MGKEVTQANFKLIEVKLLKDGGVFFHTETTDSKDDGSIETTTHKTNYPEVPARSLIDELQKFKPHFLEVFHYTYPFISMESKKVDASIIDAVRETFDISIRRNTEVVGAKVSGGLTKQGVNMNVRINIDSGQRQTIPTPKLLFSDNDRGTLLQTIWLTIEEEAFAYIYNDKRADGNQVNMFANRDADN